MLARNLDELTKFALRVSGIRRDRAIKQPYLGFLAALSDVNMRWFPGIARIEVEPMSMPVE